MPLPTNTTIETAIDVGTLPATSDTIDAAFGGTTYDLWWTGVVPTGCIEIGPQMSGNFGAWNPVLSCWSGPTSSPTQIGASAFSGIMQIPVTAGDRIYFKAESPAGNPSPAPTTLDVQLGPTATVPVGSILINDSSDGYPLIALSSSITQTVLKFFGPYPAGESNRVLTTGEVMMADDFVVNGPKIYTPDLSLFATPTMPASGYIKYGTDQSTGWWAMKPGGGATHPTAVFVAKDGTVSASVYDLGALGAGQAGKALTPNLANTKLWFIIDTSATNQPIKQITIPGAVVSNLVAGVANYNLCGTMVTLLDDSFLVGYSRSGVSEEVRHFDNTGALLHTFVMGTTTDHVEQIFTAIEDPTYFWVWTINGVTNRFRKIKISDGSTAVDVSSVQFVEGVYQDAASATPTARFGTDFSCVPWISRSAFIMTATYPIRRQRRFMAPASDSGFMMNVPVLELRMRTGIGLTPGPASDPPVLGSDPQVMYRFSKDGGKTWTPERWASAGAIGRFKDRVRFTRATGNYRNGVFEITVSDPCDFQFLAALAPNGIIEGSS